MKNIYLIVLFSIFLVSCGGNKEKSVADVIADENLKEIRAKKNLVSAELKEAKNKIRLLEDAISKLDTTKKKPLITTFKVKKEEFKHYLELQGNVDTKTNLIIHPEFNGLLTNVYVKEGQNVVKGQLLAKIDDGGLSQQLAQLKIQADLAKTTFERQQRLWDQKIGSEMQYLQAKSTYEAQSQAVNQIMEQLAKTQVRAPFSGTIDDVITEQGSVVAAGQSQLMRIVNLNNMYIETDVPESHITNVTNGKNVIVEFPILGDTINATIRQVGNYINPINRSFKIEIAIPNKDNKIKPNLTAKLKINDYVNEHAILIPQSIISENANGEQYVYIIKDKTAENTATVVQKIITTGKTQGDVIEVLTGLDDSSEIIKEGARTVKVDQTVEIKSEATNE